MRISDWSSDVCSSDLPAYWMRIAYGRADGEESGNRATFGASRRIRRHARGGKSGPSRSRLVAERPGARGSRRVYCVAAYVAQRQERRMQTRTRAVEERRRLVRVAHGGRRTIT